MQTAEAIDDTIPLDDAEYTTLEQTLMESQRGRRFLNDFLKRHKTPETQEILSAIQRLEKSMTRKSRVPDLDRIRLDIAEMHEAIERTKREIANIKAEGDESNRFVDASHELDAIITQTEGATQTILEAAEQIQEQAWILREAGADTSACDEIDAKSTEIFMACSFQDLTGQRTNKVVQVMRYLESRINMMINIWGIEDEEAATDMAPADERPDAHLLNGPQREGKGTSQAGVDELLDAEGGFDAIDTSGSSDTVAADFDFDAIEMDDDDATEAEEVAAEAAGMADVLDADDIDKLFDTAGETDETVADAADDAFDVAEAVADDEDVPEFSIGEAADEDAASPDDMMAEAGDDEILDEAAIDKLFDQEVEAAADDDWQAMESEEIDEENDPLKQLSEAERQALFN